MSEKHPKNNAYRLVRIARDMKTQEIADALDVTRAYISAIEQGIREPALDKISKYASILNIDPNTLFRIRELCENDLPFEILLRDTLVRILEYDTRTTIQHASTFQTPTET